MHSLGQYALNECVQALDDYSLRESGRIKKSQKNVVMSIFPHLLLPRSSSMGCISFKRSRFGGMLLLWVRHGCGSRW